MTHPVPIIFLVARETYVDARQLTCIEPFRDHRGMVDYKKAKLTLHTLTGDHWTITVLASPSIVFEAWKQAIQESGANIDFSGLAG